MSLPESWRYEEIQIGRDYDTPEEVAAYDARHGTFRDVDRENDAILALLGLAPGDTVIEVGCGTGAFAIRASRACARVYAVDISRAMLDYAAAKAARLGADNVVFRQAGFLTYRHDGAPADAIVTNTALHHLPDFWKGMALQRLNGMLQDGGLLYLSDVVFAMEDAPANIERWFAKLEGIGGAALRRDVETHVRQEFSTFDWILDGLLERTGFRILRKEILEGVVGRYLCRKTRSAPAPPA